MPVENIHAGPGKTNLKNGEIVVNFQFPKKQKILEMLIFE